MLDNYLNWTKVPASLLNVTQASVLIRFKPVGNRKAKSLGFNVSFPDSCDLKSQPEELRKVGEKYLKRWGIAGE